MKNLLINLSENLSNDYFIANNHLLSSFLSMNISNSQISGSEISDMHKPDANTNDSRLVFKHISNTKTVLSGATNAKVFNSVTNRHFHKV